MFLKELYRVSKLWFAIVVLFILAQLFINFKQGIVFSPFYHYGMYSEVMQPEASYRLFEVKLNGKVLQAKDFSAQQWDKIIQPLVYFSKHDTTNRKMFSEAQRIMAINDPAPYVNKADTGFYSWYRNYLSEIIDAPVRSLSVSPKIYQP